MTIKLGKSIALNTSTYTAITLPSAAHRNVSARTSDQTEWLMAWDASGLGAQTIWAEKSVSINNIGDRDETIFYAKASAGTPTLDLLWE